MTNLRKILFTEPCPNCGVPTQKVEGCEHMVCIKCKHEYCWLCLFDYKDYEHKSKQSRDYCIMRQVLYFVCIAFCLQVVWVKCALPYTLYMAEENVLDRLNRGDSLLVRENFVITLISGVWANIYVIETFIICDFTQDR